MDLSPQIQGSHVTVSPAGQYLALISNGKLRICVAHAPERYTDVSIRVQAKDVAALRWNDESSRIAIVSARDIEVVDLADASHRVRLDNGSGGLGRFVSADFIEDDHLLVIWEFGKAKIWDLSNGKGVEIIDAKMVCTGSAWQIRPRSSNAAKATPTRLAMICRPGADDLLNLYFPTLNKQDASLKLPTIDAQSLSWSPDGMWLSVLETPTASPSVHFFLGGRHHFRTYPSTGDSTSHGLGIKSIMWSGNSQMLALTRHDGRIVLLNTRTFAPLAIIEHTTTIDQRTAPTDQQAPIWQESVSASGERSYAGVAQPFSPPLSKIKQSSEPSELGVAEAKFSSDGSYLATRDERMLNSVWIWNMATLGAHAVLVQHSNVRKLHWHPTKQETLMVDCGEGIAYLFDASSSNPPTPHSTSSPRNTMLSWLPTATSPKTAILAVTKTSLRVAYPDGRPDDTNDTLHDPLSQTGAEQFDEGASEDSLFDVLSGRKPLPPKTEESYTERVDLEVATEDEDTSTRLDDTFREKRTGRPIPVDPFDDSEIF